MGCGAANGISTFLRSARELWPSHELAIWRAVSRLRCISRSSSLSIDSRGARFIDPDYRKRMTIEELLAALRENI